MCNNIQRHKNMKKEIDEDATQRTDTNKLPLDKPP
jgi:hypothetical protein